MANWKLNGSREMLSHYITSLNHHENFKPKKEVVIYPPAIYLPYFQENANSNSYSWGAQNVSSEKSGAFTGEIAGEMLKEYGVSYILVGHSERRHVFAEPLNLIAKKFHLVKDCGMIPVVCIGETLKDYQQGLTQSVLQEQLQTLKIDNQLNFQNVIIAYEPVWAIGSGLTPSKLEIKETLQAIQRLVSELDNQTKIPPILYGGSVSHSNIEMINEIDECQGVLIGGASLNVEQFLEIIQCITCY
jgi:triosephosphate isomerase (TIM)